MSLADFIEGYYSTLKWSATTQAQTALKRELMPEEIKTQETDDELIAFYEKHADTIENAKGLEGLSRSVAWQAGHDLCFARNGREGFKEDDWGADAETLATESVALGKREIEYKDGKIATKADAIAIDGKE